MNNGFVTLMGVLIVGALMVAAALIGLQFSVSDLDGSIVFGQSIRARALVDACAEEALQEIRDSDAFVGSGGFSLGQGSCSYTVASGGGENRSIEAEGVVADVVHRAELSITQLHPVIVIDSWQEVDDF